MNVSPSHYPLEVQCLEKVSIVSPGCPSPLRLTIRRRLPFFVYLSLTQRRPTCDFRTSCWLGGPSLSFFSFFEEFTQHLPFSSPPSLPFLVIVGRRSSLTAEHLTPIGRSGYPRVDLPGCGLAHPSASFLMVRLLFFFLQAPAPSPTTRTPGPPFPYGCIIRS